MVRWMDGQLETWMDGWMDGWVGEQTVWWMDEWMDGQLEMWLVDKGVDGWMTRCDRWRMHMSGINLSP